MLFVLFSSCSFFNKEETKLDFNVNELDFFTNYNSKIIELDYDGALENGFVIPSVKQTNNGFFNFCFSITNNSNIEKEYYYKVYYQNDSYKFPEQDARNENVQNEFAHENFYGSWENIEIGFIQTQKIKPGESLKVIDSLRIVGNPRNEEKYYYKGENDRWKRNPRMGEYSVLLVVVDKDNLNKIPDYIKHIDIKHNETFITPYFYFLYGDGKNIDNCYKFLQEKVIKIVAKPNLGAGIYSSDYAYDKSTKDLDKFYSCNCNQNGNMYKKAHFEQFIHYVDESSKLFNVPIVEDFFDGNFTNEEYNWLRAFYRTEDRITVLPQVAQFPCETVASDSINNKIVMRNPATKYGEWQKQNVGVITRHGFTYGKYTVKVKLTELLNKDNVWNGITNAIWLIHQPGRGNETGWNLRRPCRNNGYMKTYWGGRYDDRVEQVSYSEIDFEILKTVPYCPSGKFPPVYKTWEAINNMVSAWNVDLPNDVKKDEGKIAVCCTNWDMACWDPKNFSTGCHKIEYNGKSYFAHRWDDTYRAVTTKYMAYDDELFASDYYYFQIDWQPERIIWRIGPQKNKLYDVGYIDNTISMIPENQMVLIITQEFHNTDWWPGSPYEQKNIPFPAKDYVGEIYEITIE